MLDRISPKQFSEWVAYKRLEPDKLDRIRVILTRGLTALVNAWRDSQKLELKDIDPWHEDPEPEEVTQGEAMRRMRAHTGG